MIPKHKEICWRAGLCKDAGTGTGDYAAWRLPDALMEKIIESVDPMELPRYASNCEAAGDFLLPILADKTLWKVSSFETSKTRDKEIDAMRDHILKSLCHALDGLWPAILEAGL